MKGLTSEKRDRALQTCWDLMAAPIFERGRRKNASDFWFRRECRVVICSYR